MTDEAPHAPLPDGYFVVGSFPGESFVVEIRGPHGFFGELTQEPDDPDVVVIWPTGPEWKTEELWDREREGGYSDVVRSLEMAKDFLVGNPRVEVNWEERARLYKLAEGETLGGEYTVLERKEQGDGKAVLEIFAPNGIVAILSRDEGDKDVVIRWPVDHEAGRSPRGYFTDIMRALEYGKDRLLSLQGKRGQ